MNAWSVRFSTLAVLAFENALIVGAVAASVRLRLGAEGLVTFGLEGGIWKTLVIAVVSQLGFAYAGLYNYRGYANPKKLLLRLPKALAVTASVLAVLYFWFPWLIVGRGVFLLAATLLVTLVGASRLAAQWFTNRGTAQERLLIVGTTPQAINLARELFDRRTELGVEIVGFVDPDPRKVRMPAINPGIIGTIDDIPALAISRRVNRVVVSLTDARGQLPMDKLLKMKMEGVRFDYLASVYEQYTGKIAVENLRPSWLIFSTGFQKSAHRNIAKRLFDVLVSSIGLVVALPVIIIIAAALKLACKGPVLYSQQRVGENGRLFTIYKFRTMRVDAEIETGAVWATVNDGRVTVPGRFLRRTRLDELPQLWNILTGEMSLVGPRPERPEFVSVLTSQIRYYGQRHTVKPGLTGWAQVHYSYGNSIDDALKKLQYDLYYVKNFTIQLDVLILLKTFRTVLFERGSVPDSQSTHVPHVTRPTLRRLRQASDRQGTMRTDAIVVGAPAMQNRLGSTRKVNRTGSFGDRVC